MRKKGIKAIASLILLGSFLYLSGCTEKSNKPTETKVTIKNPDAKEVLSLDKNADIFQFNGEVYKADIDWVDKLKLTKKELLGEISGNSRKSFKDGIANKLPVGAKIYSAKDPLGVSLSC
ncbi:hypothetical protein [Fictibacillus sp. KU28468]|uniref:hypothetical protein n=1 Tax=Fictibacillus sp. KU28468 TaxID=2991053 RepID=UPI00223E077E|nr:hypothetical protein [Fictibacillus sp. KU28468]UZJ76810.1 hypothetical protein OKX00_11290 [Fictibacillus sp. KU28468]